MKKTLAFLLALITVLGLLTGCSQAPAEEPTDESLASSGLPAAPSDLMVLKNADEDLCISYNILAVSPDAPFSVSDAAVNTAGADALIFWLTSIDGLRLIDSFGIEEFGDRLIYIQQNISVSDGNVTPAVDSAKVIRLATTTVFRELGLLDQLLPVFEADYGYTVELFSGTAEEVMAAAEQGAADLLILHDETQETDLVDRNFIRIVTSYPSERISFVYHHLLLCGPSSDPAGISTTETAADAFSAIGKGEFPFISCGDGSFIHTEELRHWPASLGITADPTSFNKYKKWYISAGSDIDTCLDMAREKGAYILTNKIAFLNYQAEQATKE